MRVWSPHATPADDEHRHSFGTAQWPRMQWQSPSPCEWPLYSRHLTQHFWKGFLELRTLKVFLLQGFSEKILLLCSALNQKKKSNKIQLPRVQVGNWPQRDSRKETGVESAHTEARRETFTAIFGCFWRKRCPPVWRTSGGCSWRLSSDEQRVLSQ